jgi:predicted MFS family arabinose efflux permease
MRTHYPSAQPAAGNSASELSRARRATFAYFGLNGFVLGMWVVHIPSIEARIGVSPATLGWLLLLLGLGAFTGLKIFGPLTDRWGPRRAVPASAFLCSVGLLGPAFATTSWQLGTALFALGFANGCLDVAMNTHAVHVEARYGRPIMSAFHAVYSVGGFAAALIGARTLAWRWSTQTTLAIVAAVACAVALSMARGLLVSQPSDHPTNENPRTPRAGRRVPRQIWLLAALALLLMLTEGVANDWSALAARDDLGASTAVAALAYGAFAGAMTSGRFLADRIAARAGPVAIVRYGSALAALALAIIVTSPWIGLTLVGWALLGFGLSGSVPQIFSAAGHTDPSASGTNVSRVAGIGYLGMLAGPAIIGPLTRVTTIQHALVFPMLLCAAVVLFAHKAVPADSTQEAVPSSV